MQQNISEKTSIFIAKNFPGQTEVTPKQVAISFGVSSRTIYRYIESGKIPATRKFGYKIEVNKLAAWLDNTDNF